MRRRILTALMAGVLIGVIGAPTTEAKHKELSPGCYHPACTKRVCKSDKCKMRIWQRRVPEVLSRIASCESGGRPTAIGGGGAFRGKYQFTFSTWNSVGGHGDPAAAPESEQDYRAGILYAREGIHPWPVCGPRAV